MTRTPLTASVAADLIDSNKVAQMEVSKRGRITQTSAKVYGLRRDFDGLMVQIAGRDWHDSGWLPIAHVHLIG